MRSFQVLSRNHPLATTGLVLLLLFSGTPVTQRPNHPNDKLNLIVILADDVSAEEFGCYGGTLPTPNIDKLASEGVRFKTAFGTPMCTPSRAMLLTGLYPDKTGVFHNSLRPLQKDGDSRWHWGHAFDLLPEVFQRNGYRTLIAGKWQMDGQYPNLGFDYGFDEYCLHHEWVRKNGWNQPAPKHARYSGLIAGDQDLFPDRTSGYWYPSIVVNGLLVKTAEDDFGPDIFNDYVLNFVQRNQNRPFMVYYPMMLAHTVTDFQSPDRSDKEKQFHQIFTRCPEIQNGTLTGKMGQENFQTNLEYMDFLVGRLMDKLDKLGIRDKTLVVFTSDNATLGKGKACASPRGSHIPMIVSCPGVVQRQVVRETLVSLVDIYPTVTHLAGVSDSSKATLDGVDMSMVLTGAKPDFGRDWVYSFLADQSWIRNREYLLDNQGRFYEIGDVENNQPELMKRISLPTATKVEFENYAKLKRTLDHLPRFTDLDSEQYARYVAETKKLLKANWQLQSFHQGRHESPGPTGVSDVE